MGDLFDKYEETDIVLDDEDYNTVREITEMMDTLQKIIGVKKIEIQSHLMTFKNYKERLKEVSDLLTEKYGIDPESKWMYTKDKKVVLIGDYDNKE